MAQPIGATPILKGKDAQRFLTKVRADANVPVGRTPTPKLEKAIELIETAQRIFFLGFGYAKENLEILQLPDILENQRIYGTALGLPKREIATISSRFKKRSYKPDIHSLDCLQLLR